MDASPPRAPAGTATPFFTPFAASVTPEAPGSAEAPPRDHPRDGRSPSPSRAEGSSAFVTPASSAEPSPRPHLRTASPAAVQATSSGTGTPEQVSDIPGQRGEDDAEMKKRGEAGRGTAPNQQPARKGSQPMAVPKVAPRAFSEDLFGADSEFVTRSNVDGPPTTSLLAAIAQSPLRPRTLGVDRDNRPDSPKPLDITPLAASPSLSAWVPPRDVAVQDRGTASSAGDTKMDVGSGVGPMEPGRNRTPDHVPERSTGNPSVQERPARFHTVKGPAGDPEPDHEGPHGSLAAASQAFELSDTAPVLQLEGRGAGDAQRSEAFETSDSDQLRLRGGSADAGSSSGAGTSDCGTVTRDGGSGTGGSFPVSHTGSRATNSSAGPLPDYVIITEQGKSPTAAFSPLLSGVANLEPALVGTARVPQGNHVPKRPPGDPTEPGVAIAKSGLQSPYPAPTNGVAGPLGAGDSATKSDSAATLSEPDASDPRADSSSLVKPGAFSPLMAGALACAFEEASSSRDAPTVPHMRETVTSFTSGAAASALGPIPAAQHGQTDGVQHAVGRAAGADAESVGVPSGPSGGSLPRSAVVPPERSVAESSHAFGAEAEPVPPPGTEPLSIKTGRVAASVPQEAGRAGGDGTQGPPSGSGTKGDRESQKAGRTAGDGTQGATSGSGTREHPQSAADALRSAPKDARASALEERVSPAVRADGARHSDAHPSPVEGPHAATHALQPPPLAGAVQGGVAGGASREGSGGRGESALQHVSGLSEPRQAEAEGFVGDGGAHERSGLEGVETAVAEPGSPVLTSWGSGWLDWPLEGPLGSLGSQLTPMDAALPSSCLQQRGDGSELREPVPGVSQGPSLGESRPPSEVLRSPTPPLVPGDQPQSSSAPSSVSETAPGPGRAQLGVLGKHDTGNMDKRDDGALHNGMPELDKRGVSMQEKRDAGVMDNGLDERGGDLLDNGVLDKRDAGVHEKRDAGVMDNSVLAKRDAAVRDKGDGPARGARARPVSGGGRGVQTVSAHSEGAHTERDASVAEKPWKAEHAMENGWNPGQAMENGLTPEETTAKGVYPGETGSPLMDPLSKPSDGGFVWEGGDEHSGPSSSGKSLGPLVGTAGPPDQTLVMALSSDPMGSRSPSLDWPARGPSPDPDATVPGGLAPTGPGGPALDGSAGGPSPDPDGVAGPDPNRSNMLDQAMGILRFQALKGSKTGGTESPKSGTASPPAGEAKPGPAEAGDKRTMKQSLRELEASAKSGLQSLRAAMEDIKGRTSILSPKNTRGPGVMGMLSPSGSSKGTGSSKV